MRKKIIISLAILALCLTASVTLAGVTTFSKFKVNVPDGWTATQEGPTVNVIANDKSAAISIGIDSTQGMALKDLAAAMSQALNGSTPTQDPSDGSYHFTFSKGQVASNAYISMMDETGKEYIMIAITGDNPQVQAILESVEDI